MMEEETILRHNAAFRIGETDVLPAGGFYHYRRDGEKHLWNPLSISKLQLSTRAG